MTKARLTAAVAALALTLLTAPAARSAAPAALPTPLARAYDSTDLLRAQRLAIAALQDLGFALESADAARGSVSASRLDTHALRLTVTITATTDSTIAATITTDYAGAPTSDPRAAEAFFAAFERQLAPPPAFD